jgi:hypothetical protein
MVSPRPADRQEAAFQTHSGRLKKAKNDKETAMKTATGPKN